MFDTIITKALEFASNANIGKILIVALLAVLAYFLYITKDSISTFVHVTVENATRTEYYIPKDLNIPKENIESMQQSARSYMNSNQRICMIAVYKFVPDHDTFYQGRILVSSSAQLNSKIVPDKYNIKWLPISSMTAQMRLILKGKIFTADIKKILTEYLKPGSEVRDEYLSPVNINSMYLDGARYMVSVPVISTRVIGYVTVVFDTVPSTDLEITEFIELAKSVAGDTGYYISF